MFDASDKINLLTYLKNYVSLQSQMSVIDSIYNKYISSKLTVITWFNPLSANFTKSPKHTQTSRRQFPDEMFECLAILWDWRLKD